jgi:hypothetical protein
MRHLIPDRLLLEAPFHFIISTKIARSEQDSPEQCLNLPPSLELGDHIVDISTGHRFAQPSITYYLRAAATFRDTESDTIKSLETILPIIIEPQTEELPPTETSDFPSEFKERESKILRRTLLGSSIGTLNISLHEPPPLSYDSGSSYSSTEAILNLEFSTPNTQADTLKSLNGLKFKVYSLVRVKTFYSVKAFPGPPGQDFLSTQKDTRLRDDIVKLENKTVTNASWGFRFDLESHNEAGPPTSLSRSLSPGRSSDDKADRPPSISESKSQDSNGRWISNWTVPVQVNGRLLPTFCSAIVARYYSLVIRVKVSGVRQEAFDLEVPLQVIHTSSSPSPSISESFLETRGQLEESWFGGGMVRYIRVRGAVEEPRLMISQDTEDSPPRYYK